MPYVFEWCHRFRRHIHGHVRELTATGGLDQWAVVLATNDIAIGLILAVDGNDVVRQVFKVELPIMLMGYRRKLHVISAPLCQRYVQKLSA
jgi:hypothetical protein